MKHGSPTRFPDLTFAGLSLDSFFWLSGLTEGLLGGTTTSTWAIALGYSRLQRQSTKADFFSLTTDHPRLSRVLRFAPRATTRQLLRHAYQYARIMGEHMGSRVANVIFRFFQLSSAAIVAGIVGWALHRIDTGNGSSNGKLIYVELVAAMSIVVSIVLIVPFEYVFKAWPLDIIL